MILTQLPEQNLARFGEYPFIYYGESVFSNRDLLESANKLASVLIEQGLKKGDRVLCVCRTCPRFSLPIRRSCARAVS